MASYVFLVPSYRRQSERLGEHRGFAIIRKKTALAREMTTSPRLYFGPCTVLTIYVDNPYAGAGARLA